jgi:hypothetical protein
MPRKNVLVSVQLVITVLKALSYQSPARTTRYEKYQGLHKYLIVHLALLVICVLLVILLSVHVQLAIIVCSESHRRSARASIIGI